MGPRQKRVIGGAVSLFSLGVAQQAVADEAPSTPSQTAVVAPTNPKPAPVNPNLASWSLIKLNASDVASANGGSGVKVAVLDGVTDCRDTDLAGRCSNVFISGGTYGYYSNHGTHTAGIVAGKQFGIATSATVINYAVFDDNGFIATGTRLSDAWKSAYGAGARVSSMSFGCAKTALCFTATELTTMANSAMPMLYVKAAGNDGVALPNEAVGVNASTANAALNRTILVGSVNSSGVISSFSNRPGEGCLLASGVTACTDTTKWKYHFLVAPGEAIYSTLPGNAYGAMTGTSMATPVVAGVAALLQQRWPSLKSSPETLAKILFTTATDAGAPGVDAVYGYGIVNVAGAFRANGAIALVSPGGGTTVVSSATIVLPSTVLGGIGGALAQTTVYDSFGRDFTLAETGALVVRPRTIAVRQLLGRALLGADAMEDWTSDFFADQAPAKSFALFGSPADPSARGWGLDQTARVGVDLPFRWGALQFRLTGSGDPRLDFAYDSSMRPLANFASTELLRGALISNAQIKISDRSRLMAYGIGTPGAVNPQIAYDPMAARLTDRGYMPRAALTRDGATTRQTGFGLGYWTRADENTVLGLNASAISQTGGYYTLTSNLSDFERPTRLFNLGVAANRRMGDWELAVSGEITHMQMNQSDRVISFTPANLVSARLGLRKSGVAFAGEGMRDSLSFAFTLPPRALSGDLALRYMTRTADGLGRQAVDRHVPLSQLGQEPAKVEAAYQLRSGTAWSFSLSGGLNLARPDGEGAGEAMAMLKVTM